MIRMLLTGMVLFCCVGVNAETKPLPYNDFQRGFMQVVLDYSKKYPAAKNELQKSALVTERNERFKKLKGDPRHIKDWLGVLVKMGTNGDGHAWVVVSLSPDLLTVSTMNNSFSDMDDHSLIPQGSPMFAKLAKMKEGNVVKFSGRLKRTTNITEEGKMVTPNFLFVFSDIEKIGESAIR